MEELDLELNRLIARVQGLMDDLHHKKQERREAKVHASNLKLRLEKRNSKKFLH